MRKPLIVAAVLAAAAACASPTPPPVWENDPEAMRIAAEWLERSQGFDALEAWEMSGLAQDYHFAFARKWTGARVKVLAYVLSPAIVKDAAYLTHLQPGEPADGWLLAPGPMIRKNQPIVTRLRGTAPPGSSDASIGAEVASPMLLDDYAYRLAPDEVVDGEPCTVIESRPLTEVRRRGYDRVVHWISRHSGAALLKVYYRGTLELRRVSIRDDDVSESAGRLVVNRLLIREADGDVILLTLRNSVPEVELPDNLFTVKNLRARRFPRF